MQTAGPVTFGQGTVSGTAQQLGAATGQCNNGLTVKALAGNGNSKVYVGVIDPTLVVAAWSGSTGYTVGTIVNNSGYLFRCTVGGISASSGGPSQQNTNVIDGGVTWQFLRIYTAPSAWAGTTAYAVGNRVTNNGNVYNCSAGGTSAGSGGPTTQGAAIVDGTVVWQFLGTYQLTGSNGFELAAAAQVDVKVIDPTTCWVISNGSNVGYCWMAS